MWRWHVAINWLRSCSWSVTSAYAWLQMCPHVHGLAWLPSAPDVQLFTYPAAAEENRQQAIAFIDSIITTTPALLPDGSNLSEAPCAQIHCHGAAQVKALEELLESLVEKPVSYSWVVNDCTSAGTCILWTLMADQVCKFWPLKVSSTVSEEDRRNSKCVDHGYQAATLFHPVGTCSPERTSVVTDTAGKRCTDHFTQLVHRKA